MKRRGCSGVDEVLSNFQGVPCEVSFRKDAGPYHKWKFNLGGNNGRAPTIHSGFAWHAWLASLRGLQACVAYKLAGPSNG